MNEAQVNGTGDLAELRNRRLRASLRANGGGTALGLPIGAGENSNIPPKMQEGWDGYWAAYNPLVNGQPAKVGTGGTLTRMSIDEAVYWRSGVEPFTVSPSDNLNLVANIDPAIAQAWSRDFPGFSAIPL